MAVTISQKPNEIFDQAYGPNPVTLTGIPTDPVTGLISADKYVLQIWRDGTLIADLRQTPNAQGKAIFDIQNVLQNFVAPSKNGIEEIGFDGLNQLSNSALESVQYQFAVGYEVAGAVTIDFDSAQLFTAFGGTKAYYEVEYSPTAYIPQQYSVSSNCTGVLKQAQPFTDMNTYRLGSEITDGKPLWLEDNMRVYDHYVTKDDMTTISYWNQTSSAAGGAYGAFSIGAFVFYQYNGNTLLSIDPVYNVPSGIPTDPGGGPGFGYTPTYPNKAITCGTGPKNFQDFNGASATHYYVATAPYTGASCPSTITGLADASLHYVHRFNIITPDCNDFPEYQFSWLNSYGFRDYYSFKKRKDRSVNIARNTYLKEAANYNGDSYNVNIYDRGTTVYSQTLEEQFTAFTDFISDADALFLEGLFTSADVKVRFNDAPGAEQFDWVPVALLSTTWTEKTYRKDKLFQYDIRFKIAHNLKSQRG